MNVYVDLKVVKLTKSKIQQMEYIGIPKNQAAEVLGYVNMNNKRWVIVKSDGNYYRAEFITKVEYRRQSSQFALATGGYEYPILTHIQCSTYNRGVFTYSPERNDERNQELYDCLLSFKRKTEIAGQIYF